MRLRFLMAAVVTAMVGLAPVGVASAAETTTTTTTSATTTSTTPAPTPAPTTSTPTTTNATPTPVVSGPTTAVAPHGRATLTPGALIDVDRRSVALPGRAVTVTALIIPYVAHQRVLFQAVESGRVVAAGLAVPRSARHGGAATVSFRFAAPRAGTVAVKLLHGASSTLGRFTAETHVQVLSETVALGSRGVFVDLLQSRLVAMHIYLPLTGVFDAGTQLALDTYHRLLGQGEGDTSVTAATMTDLLAGKGTFHVRFPGQGLHAEGDLSDQVLAYSHGSKVFQLLPISSGKPSTPTILGSFQVYRQQPGYLPDGMYYTNFFSGGYAIHGYDPAPDYPASHGCMRIPIVDAIHAFGLIGIGDWVDTYYT